MTNMDRHATLGEPMCATIIMGSCRATVLNIIAWNLLSMPIAFWLLLSRLRPRAEPA